MVRLLPLPGGPCTTTMRFLSTASTTRRCGPLDGNGKTTLVDVEVLELGADLVGGRAEQDRQRTVLVDEAVRRLGDAVEVRQQVGRGLVGQV